MGAGASVAESSDSLYKTMKDLDDEALCAIILGMPQDQRSRLVSSMNSTAGGGGVFDWMNWSPAPGTAVHGALHKHFSGALPGLGLHYRMKKVLTEEFGFTPENTLFGTSICPDEINSTKTGLISRMVEHWGEVFPMGGIGGAPFVGQTGFKAFASHVPDNGNILVVFAPHVALSPGGDVGKYQREGQEKLSTACGAVIGAFNAVCAGPVGDFIEADRQMCWIKAQLAPHAKECQATDAPITAATFKAYDCVRGMINEVVNTEFGTGKLILLGGIQINMPEPCTEHFLPLTFEVRQAGKEVVDVMDRLKLK